MIFNNLGKTTIGLMTIVIIMSSTPIILQAPQALAAASVKSLQVTDGGQGTFACSMSSITAGGTTSGAGAAAGINVAVTTNKVTGKVSGTWQIGGGFGTLASGDITSGKMKENSFTLSGAETYLFFDTNTCGPTPIPVTIQGQCGNDVVISFKAEKQQLDSQQTQTAVFQHASVSCTK
jgi:hypothetical protein